MQHPDPRVGKRSNDAAGMSRHIGQLGGDGFPFEPPVQIRGNPCGEAIERIIGQFAVEREGEGVPDNIALTDRLLQLFSFFRIRLFQILGDQPGSHRPDIAELAGPYTFPKVIRRFDRITDVAFEVLVNDIVRQIGESDIQMGLENEIDFFHTEFPL